jgi:hypothetical protein
VVKKQPNVPRPRGGGAFMSDVPLIGGPVNSGRKPPRGGCAVAGIALLGAGTLVAGGVATGLWYVATLVA